LAPPLFARNGTPSSAPNDPMRIRPLQRRSASFAPKWWAMSRVCVRLSSFSRHPHAYSSEDIALVQRLAAYVAVGLAHQRLAESARHAAVCAPKVATTSAASVMCPRRYRMR
jgi:hypothetical protein